MKAICICGSRNPQGQTAQAAGSVVKGLSKTGATVEQVFLPSLRVEGCRQCDENGWGTCRSKGQCVIDDDLSEVVGKMRQADVLIFASPVYYSDMSESMRALTDRLRRICTHETGRESLRGKPGIGVCVAGGGGGGSSACCVSLERVLTTAGIDVVDMIPVRRQNLQAKLHSLELVGTWLASVPKSA